MTTAPIETSDPFFVLRDCRELFQRRLSEIARHAGVNAPSVLNAFTDELGSAFDELAASSPQDSFEQTNGLTASRISLVGNDDLELEIRIGDIIGRLKDNERIDRWRVQLRFMALLKRPKMTAETNPAGLEPISCGLWAICRESGGTLLQNLERLERLEEQLQAGLPDVYSELNDLLQKLGVESAQVRPIQRSSPSASTTADSDVPVAGTAFPGNALASLRQALREGTGDSATQAPDDALMPLAAASGNALLSASTLALYNQIMERLSSFGLLASRDIAPGDHAVEPSNQPPQPFIRAKDIDLAAGTSAAVALDTISAIFEAIGANPGLPEAIKTILRRLHIPFFQLAILDETFFSNARHPARQLIDRVARAAVGLALDSESDHPLCIHLAEIISGIERAISLNDRDLAPHLAVLEKLIEQRDNDTIAASKPYFQLVAEHEGNCLAQAHVDKWLGITLPRFEQEEIRRFLAEYWRQVMLAAAVAGGTTGVPWLKAHAVIDDLLWSIQPKPLAEDRKKLLTRIPLLIRQINEGLDSIGTSQDERKPFLDACFKLQTVALRTQAPSDSPASTASAVRHESGNQPDHTTTPEIEARLLEQKGKFVQYLGAPANSRPLPDHNISAAKPGDWISVLLPDADNPCGLHCGQLAQTGTIVLFNLDWGYAVAINPGQLAQQLRDGQARIISQTRFFDDAAAEALKQLAPR